MGHAAEIQFQRYGPRAWLLRLAGAADEGTLRRRLAIEQAFAQRPPEGLIEVTPGFCSLLLEFAAEPPTAGELKELLSGCADVREAAAPPARNVDIPVVYDGPDLARVAAHAGLTPAEVIQRHANGRYVVALLGFAPGFPYLLGLDPVLHTPRLAAPRPAVPAGSVAIGGEHAGIYPAELPGGWNLIGRTNAALMRDAGDDPPETAFLFAPGDGVRFVAVDQLPAAHD